MGFIAEIRELVGFLKLFVRMGMQLKHKSLESHVGSVLARSQKNNVQKQNN